MPTGIELITEIAECSAKISRKNRLGLAVEKERARRRELRSQLAELPEISFS